MVAGVVEKEARPSTYLTFLLNFLDDLDRRDARRSLLLSPGAAA